MFRCDVCDLQLDEQAMAAGIRAPEFKTERGLNSHKMRVHSEWAAARRKARAEALARQREAARAQREREKEEARRQAVRDLQGPGDVKTFKDVVVFAINRLGCDWPEGQDWKRSLIILSYSGYEVRELADTIEWCAMTGKRFDMPWKAIVHVDAYREEKGSRLHVGAVDPIQAKLDALYIGADNDLRKRIRAASSTSDKRAALALLAEHR